MRKVLGLIGATMLFAGSALAADLPLKAPMMPLGAPVFSWTGIYIGGNYGGTWGDTDWTYLAGGTASHGTAGSLGGGTLGANWQFPSNWVVGVEGDWDWADIEGSRNCPNPTFVCQSKISDLATVRGRLGYAVDRFMVYGTGGGAWGRDLIQTNFLPGLPVPPSGTPINGTTGTRSGWIAGAGIEWAFWNSFSAKFEVLHYDLGAATTPVDNNLLVNTREHGNIIRAGLNWKFWP
jgi:outer membrane immunogenic protein